MTYTLILTETEYVLLLQLLQQTNIGGGQATDAAQKRQIAETTRIMADIQAKVEALGAQPPSPDGAEPEPNRAERRRVARAAQ